MLAPPLPSPMETEANETFEALLWALSRPGQPKGLPSAGEKPILRALLDRECKAYSADPALMPAIMGTGAVLSDLPEADHVFLGKLSSLEPLDQIALGSDLYPDEGATVVLRAVLGHGPGLRLTGPGIETRLDMQIDHLPRGFWERRRQLSRYPMGFDLFILDGAAVVGIPRSTEVEVL